MNWLIYTLLSGLFIGGSLFFRKLATKTTGPIHGFIIEGIVYGVLVFIYFIFQRDKGTVFANPWYPVLSAFSLFIGALSLYEALNVGKLSLVNVLYTSLAVGIVLVASLIVLREQLVLRQIIGLLLAVAAIFLIK